MPRPDVLTDIVYRLVGEKGIRTDANGRKMIHDIFARTLEKFLDKNNQRDYWAIDRFREVIMRVVDDIAYELRRASSTPHEPTVGVTAQQFKDAAYMVFDYSHDECEKLLKDLGKYDVGIEGPICDVRQLVSAEAA